MSLDALEREGITLHSYVEGEHRARCPQCNRPGKDTALAVLIEQGRAKWKCHRCGFSGATKPSGAATAYRPAIPAKREAEQGFSAYAARIWSESLAIDVNCLAGRYLLTRRCVLPPRDSALRWHPNLKHGPSGRMFPALVGLVTAVLDCTERLGLHRTFLAHDGSGKAQVEPAKMYLGEVRRGCIRLWPDECVTLGLGIAEGIETALSLAHELTPVWACMDAGHLAEFPVLAGVEVLTIGEDNDPAGRKAASECSRRWIDAGREVYTVRSRHAGRDLNDEAR